MHGPTGPARPSRDPNHPRSGRDVTLPRDGPEDTCKVPTESARPPAPRQQRGRRCHGTFVCRPHRTKRRGEARCSRPRCRRRRAAMSPRGPGERKSAVPPPFSSLPSPQQRPGHRHTSAGQGGRAGGQRPPRHHRDAVPPPPGDGSPGQRGREADRAQGLPGAAVLPRPAPAALTVRAAPGAAPSASGATGVGPRPPPGPWGGPGEHVTGTGRGAPGVGPAPRDRGAAPTPRVPGGHVAAAPLPPPAPVTWRPLPRRHDGGGRRGQFRGSKTVPPPPPRPGPRRARPGPSPAVTRPRGPRSSIPIGPGGPSCSAPGSAAPPCCGGGASPRTRPARREGGGAAHVTASRGLRAGARA